MSVCTVCLQGGLGRIKCIPLIIRIRVATNFTFNIIFSALVYFRPQMSFDYFLCRGLHCPGLDLCPGLVFVGDRVSLVLLLLLLRKVLSEDLPKICEM